jgi:hypothetical protein
MEFDLMKQGLGVQGAIVEANNNVCQFPTQEQARALHAKGKVVVARPVKAGDLQAFMPDDFPPEAA